MEYILIGILVVEDSKTKYLGPIEQAIWNPLKKKLPNIKFIWIMFKKEVVFIVNVTITKGLKNE